MTIPQEALDAAVAALLATRAETRFDNVRQQAHAVLEAAAPYMSTATCENRQVKP